MAIVTIFAIALCGVSGAGLPADQSPPLRAANFAIGQKLTLAGVPNFGEVNSTLYRGAHPTREGFEALAKLGISIVVDLRSPASENERTEVTKLGMQYVSIPWHCFHPQDARFASFLTLLRENPRKKVFVHCRTGDDRTGMMIAAYRMAEQGWTAKQAEKEMEAFGFRYFHNLYCPGFSSYESKFPRQFMTSPAFENLRRGERLPRQ